MKTAWKRAVGYHRRSLAENTMYRLKRLFGDRLASRQFETQATEAHVWVAALNVMTYLGMPIICPRQGYSVLKKRVVSLSIRDEHRGLADDDSQGDNVAIDIHMYL